MATSSILENTKNTQNAIIDNPESIKQFEDAMNTPDKEFCLKMQQRQ